MKKVVLIGLQLLLSVTLSAQEAWLLDDYNHEARLQVDTSAKTFTVNMDGAVSSYSYQRSGKFLQLDTQDEQAIMQLLQIDEQTIHNKYPQFPSSLSAAEKLLQRSLELPGQQMIIGKEGGAVAREEGGIVAEERNVSSERRALPWWLSLIAGAIGLIIGRKWGSKNANKPDNSREEITKKGSADLPDKASPKLEKVMALRDEIKQIKASERKAREQWLTAQERLKLAEDEVRAQQLFNEKYFTAAYTKLILPAEQALEKGELSLFQKLVLQSFAQLASLSRIRLHKRISHDEENLRQLVDGKSIENKFPEVHQQTPQDEVPNNIRHLMQLLKSQNVHGLEDTIISGYKLNNL